MASTSTSTSTAAVAAGGEGWAAVSSDVRVLVLSWLDLPSALALALTCKAMAEDFSSYNFWERRYKDMSRAEPFGALSPSCRAEPATPSHGAVQCRSGVCSTMSPMRAPSARRCT